MKFLEKLGDKLHQYSEKHSSFCGQVCALGVSLFSCCIFIFVKILSENHHGVGTILFFNGLYVTLVSFAYARYHKMSLWLSSPAQAQDTLVLRGLVGTLGWVLASIATSLLPLYLPGFFFRKKLKSNQLRRVDSDKHIMGSRV